MNALRHGLSANAIPDPETDARIDALGKRFVGAGRKNHTAINLAREAAEAQIQLHRIQSLKKLAWGPNLLETPIESQGELRHLNQLYTEEIFAAEFRISMASMRKLMPYLFDEPFVSEMERKLALNVVAAGRPQALVRYERQYANRRDRALRALTEHLA